MRRSTKSSCICGSVAVLSVAAVCLVSGTQQARGQSESRDIDGTAVASGDSGFAVCRSRRIRVEQCGCSKTPSAVGYPCSTVAIIVNVRNIPYRLPGDY